LDLYEEIPPELYAVVAEILAFIYSMDKRFV
ncbi:MAG TPA: flagellar biosynthesis protein FlhB, partial [Syntrophomonas wolfei]|nr:flagellar biosynthesis protein FlhB [Syntrophomonas wolfei]